jgi:predicted Rossmann fold nucleotide-binding protein DprA/Smf involved in DNA uptake
LPSTVPEHLVVAFTLQTMAPDAAAYPTALKQGFTHKPMPSLYAIGNLNLLHAPTIALFCSIQCPGDLILKTYELAQTLRERGIATISGFHSPIEKDCQKILLQGTQPIIHCLARSLHNIRFSTAEQAAIQADRLLLLSPFGASYHRATVELAEKRNELIGAIAQTIFIAYAAPHSKTHALAASLIQQGKAVITYNSDHTQSLLTLGATSLGHITDLFPQQQP